MKLLPTALLHTQQGYLVYSSDLVQPNIFSQYTP